MSFARFGSCLGSVYCLITRGQDVIEANVDRNFGYSSATPQDGIRNDLVRPIRIHIEELDWSSSAEGA